MIIKKDYLIGAVAGFFTGALALVILSFLKISFPYQYIIALVFIPILGWLVSLALSIIAFVLWLVLMWRAYNGEEYEVPYIGKIAREQMGKV